MGTLALNYDSIYAAAKKSEKLAEHAGDYVTGLQNKIINKINDLKGPASTSAANAISSTNEKIKRLNTKKNTYTDYAKQLVDFVDEDKVGAKAVDQSVAKMFKKDSKQFQKDNNIKINPVTRAFTFLSCAFSNSSDWARSVSDSYADAKNWVEDTWDSIKDWYRYEGGKYVANIGKALLAIGIAVATIVITVATGGIGLVAICALIGAGIAIADGIVSITNNVTAFISERSGDPAWALKISKVDKASTALRNADTGSATLNNILEFTACGIDVIEAGCAVVTLVKGIADLGKKLPAIKNLIGDESKGLLKSLVDKSCRTNEKNTAVVTFKSLKNGLKTLFTDKGTRDAIFRKFKSDCKTHFNLSTLKDTIRYEWKFGIKGTLVDLAKSPEARKRYANMLKTQIGKNGAKAWKDTFGNLASHNTVKTAKSVKSILKLLKGEVSSFSGQAGSGKLDLISKLNISEKLKKTYLSMDSRADYFSGSFDNIKGVKDSISSIQGKIGNITNTVLN